MKRSMCSVVECLFVVTLALFILTVGTVSSLMAGSNDRNASAAKNSSVAPSSDEDYSGGAAGTISGNRSHVAPIEPEVTSAATKKIYFMPQDSGSTATVMFFANTNAKSATVNITGYNGSGETAFTQDVVVGAKSFVHAVSDDLAAGYPSSWNNYVLVNFTDSVQYAMMKLPNGVKVDGYVVFNNSTGTVDPRSDQGALPLRFTPTP